MNRLNENNRWELEEYDSPRGLESNMLLVDQMQINFILDSIGVAKILYMTMGPSFLSGSVGSILWMMIMYVIL